MGDIVLEDRENSNRGRDPRFFEKAIGSYKATKNAVFADQLPLMAASKGFKYLSGKIFLGRFFFTQSKRLDRIHTLKERSQELLSRTRILRRRNFHDLRCPVLEREVVAVQKNRSESRSKKS